MSVLDVEDAILIFLELRKIWALPRRGMGSTHYGGKGGREVTFFGGFEKRGSVRRDVSGDVGGVVVGAVCCVVAVVVVVLLSAAWTASV